jgi:hemoglobin
VTFVRLGGDAPRDDGPDEPAAPASTDFARLRGAAGLRAIIDDFMAQVFADAMIGFLFAAVPKARIRELEYRYAAAHLGGPDTYDGRPLGEAHRASPISGGHFMRRRQILLETLRAHGAPEDVIERWLAHVDAQRALVLGHHVDACGPEVPR